MQITYNQSELETIITTHIVDDVLPGVNPEDINNVAFNEDGSVTIVIGEEVSHEDDTPPVVEKRTRRTRKNSQEAKHRPVNQEPETGEQTPTTVGGQNESSSQETEVATPGAGLPNDPNGTKAASAAESEEATQQVEDTASDEVAEEAKAQEEVQEEKAAEAPAAKPSLFANLKR